MRGEARAKEFRFFDPSAGNYLVQRPGYKLYLRQFGHKKVPLRLVAAPFYFISVKALFLSLALAGSAAILPRGGLVLLIRVPVRRSHPLVLFCWRADRLFFLPCFLAHTPETPSARYRSRA